MLNSFGARSVTGYADGLIGCILPRSVACSAFCHLCCLYKPALPSAETTPAVPYLHILAVGTFTDGRQLMSGTTDISRPVQDIAKQQRCCKLLHPCILGWLTDNKNAKRTPEQAVETDPTGSSKPVHKCDNIEMLIQNLHHLAHLNF